MGDRLKKRGRIWHAWIPQPGGGLKLKTTNCTDRRAAEFRAAELERIALDPAHAAAYQTTTRDACDRFLASRKRKGRAAGTLHHYRVKLGHAVRLLPTRLADVTHGVLEGYYDRRLEEGAAQTTAKKDMRAIGAMLRYAKRAGLWTGDLASVMPEIEDSYTPRTDRVTYPEAGRLVAALSVTDNAQDEAVAVNRACMVAFIVATGARWSEAVRAEYSDIDFVAGLVHLRGTKTKRAKRDVPITPITCDAIAWVALEAERWGWTRGKMFRPWTNVVRDLDVACRQAKVERVTPNGLRRTFGSWLRAAGIAPDLIGMAMGHADSRMVERVYGKVSPDELKRLLSARYVLSEPAESGQTAASLTTGDDDNEA